MCFSNQTKGRPGGLLGPSVQSSLLSLFHSACKRKGNLMRTTVAWSYHEINNQRILQKKMLCRNKEMKGKCCSVQFRFYSQCPSHLNIYFNMVVYLEYLKINPIFNEYQILFLKTVCMYKQVWREGMCGRWKKKESKNIVPNSNPYHIPLEILIPCCHGQWYLSYLYTTLNLQNPDQENSPDTWNDQHIVNS